MADSRRERIKEETVRKAVNALLKWRQKKLQSNSDHEEEEEEESEGDDFIYLSLTLKKVPPKALTLAPHRIPLRHSLLPEHHSTLNLCLIVDGKKVTAESALKALAAQGGDPSVNQVLKLSKLKSDYRSFDSKKRLYDSFDAFFATENAVPLLPKVLGKVFYKKKADCSNLEEEIESACNSSLLCLSAGTCSAVRVGRWGVTEGGEIIENVYEAIDRVVEIVPRKWAGIKCFHLKFSDSLALPIYEYLQPGGEDGGSSLVGEKRKRGVLDSARKK
ncbi:hypothetical protein MIMGU_mgv1a011683mg [Erythranthe guttata]|uniref:Ribosomal protein L1 n=1 Tax=Erythranthe guttata TaxID=4155 RepID=A0A022QQL8_ERYGU|nr:hypothetical protein MIMGU_mgv1a011683mg [Erythranthe guttata]